MLLAVTFALGLAPMLGAQPPAEWTALTARLVRASDEASLSDLRTARAGALRAVVSPPPGVSAALAHYTLAYADYRLAADERVGGAEHRCQSQGERYGEQHRDLRYRMVIPA